MWIMPNADPLISQTLNATQGMELPVECVNCQVTTFHRVLASAETIHGIADDTGRVLNDHQIIQCQGCKNISFRNLWGIADTGASQPMTETVNLFPPRRDRSKRTRMLGVQYLPKSILPIYFETLEALNGRQPILAGVGIRALVESVCKHKRAAGRNLEKKIDSLAAKGLLSVKDTKILQKLRHLGNRAAHVLKPPSPQSTRSGYRHRRAPIEDCVRGSRRCSTPSVPTLAVASVRLTCR